MRHSSGKRRIANPEWLIRDLVYVALILSVLVVINAVVHTVNRAEPARPPVAIVQPDYQLNSRGMVYTNQGIIHLGK